MVSDSELAIAAASGDRGALADIYDRYGNTLYELCRVVLGDPHEASDAVQDTFVIAATRLGGLRDPSRLKPWLCAIARHESIRRSSKRARNRPVRDEVLEVPVTDDAAAGLVAADAANLVWESAEALTERERAVLMLNVRQGLEGAELAVAAGMPGPATSVLLSRAKTQLASAVRCTLLIRRGRDDCAELAQLVPRKHAALDALTRKRVSRHAANCPICATTWNATPEALGVLAATPLLGAPVALRHKVLNDPRLISFSHPLGDGHWQHDGFPPIEDEQESPRRIFAWLAAAVAVLVVAGALVFAANDKPRSLEARRGPTATTDASGVEEFAPWPTDAPGARTTTTKKGATTTTTKRATTTTMRPGAGATPPPAPTTTAEPRLTISASASPDSIGCRQYFTVTAQTHNRPLNEGEFLVLRWESPSNSGGVNMTQSGSSWTAQSDRFSFAEPTTVTWWVEARQLFGGTTAETSRRSMPVASCNAG